MDDSQIIDLYWKRQDREKIVPCCEKSLEKVDVL